MSLVFTPNWFINGDILIEFFSFIVLSVFFILCFKNYQLNKNKRILNLGLGFGFIAIAQLSLAITKLVLFYDISIIESIGKFIINSGIVKSIDSLYNVSFFFHRILTLLGFYIIYRLPTKRKFASDFVLAIYFIILSAILGNEFYYLFNITALILLVLITHNYYFIYKKNRFANTKVLVLAFGMLAFSQFLLIFSKIEKIYVAGNIIGLVSYVTLLFLILRILKHGKKKKPHGHHFRHVRHNSRKRW